MQTVSTVIEYSGKLQDPRWQKKRLEVFQRDNWTCQCCGSKTTQLEIHHVDYWDGKQPWEYPNDMLLTACRTCHGSEQIRFKHEKYLLQALKQNGFMANDLLALSTMLTHRNFKEFLLKKIRQYSQS